MTLPCFKNVNQDNYRSMGYAIKTVSGCHSTSQEIPVAIDWGRIIDGYSHSSKSKDREKGTKVIKPASLVGLGDYELKTTFRRNN